jgi:hypothetical protein
MPLSPEDALTLRDGDIVLVPARVHRTNNHWSPGTGVSVYLVDPTPDRRLNSERDAKPQRDPLATVSGLIHSVVHQDLRVKDRVEFAEDDGVITTGTILFIDEETKEATIRLEVPVNARTLTRPLKVCKRVLDEKTREAAQRGERP